jgi:hypothetical protein
MKGMASAMPFMLWENSAFPVRVRRTDPYWNPFPIERSLLTIT